MCGVIMFKYKLCIYYVDIELITIVAYATLRYSKICITHKRNLILSISTELCHKNNMLGLQNASLCSFLLVGVHANQQCWSACWTYNTRANWWADSEDHGCQCYGTLLGRFLVFCFVCLLVFCLLVFCLFFGVLLSLLLFTFYYRQLISYHSKHHDASH